MQTALITTSARPDRVVALLAQNGVHPVVHHAFADHARPPALRDRVELFLVTGKAAAHWPSNSRAIGRIEHEVDLESDAGRTTYAALLGRLDRLSEGQ
jgi:hypothetical protein